MVKKSIQLIYWEVEQLSDLTPSDQALLQLARKALSLAYAPYSKFQVGVAMRLQSGNIIQAGNQENAAYPMCLCAEQVAISKAMAVEEPDDILEMAITVSSAQHVQHHPASPCGACRQILMETEQRLGRPIRLILQGQSGPIWVLPSCSSLLPLAFDNGFLMP